MSKRPWWILKFDPCPSILDYVDWDFINVQASIMMTIVILSMLKHPTWWLLWFDPCPSILDGDYCNLIHVQASLMILIGILSMSKHTWWWWGFDQCTSILVDDHRDFNPCLKTNFFCWVVWIAQSGKALSFRRRGPGFESRGQPYAQCFHPALGMWTLVEGWSIGSEPAIDITHAPAGSDTLRGLVGKWRQVETLGITPLLKQWNQFLSSWPKIGCDDNWNCHRDQIFVRMTKKLVTQQFQLSSWPNFCHNDKKMVTRQKIKKQKERPLIPLLACVSVQCLPSLDLSLDPDLDLIGQPTMMTRLTFLASIPAHRQPGFSGNPSRICWPTQPPFPQFLPAPSTTPMSPLAPPIPPTSPATPATLPNKPVPGVLYEFLALMAPPTTVLDSATLPSQRVALPLCPLTPPTSPLILPPTPLPTSPLTLPPTSLSTLLPTLPLTMPPTTPPT